ncbi:hypothetical protein D3C81_2060330 [compost metagenome]
MHQLLDQLKKLAHIASQNSSCQLGELLCRNPPGHAKYLLVRHLPIRVGGNLIKNAQRVAHPPVRQAGDIL